MSLSKIVKKSKLISNGCKRYYEELVRINQKSIKNNWKITSGKYSNFTFVNVFDATMSENLSIGLTSVYKYKKTLKALGLIDILPKFTTRTTRCKNYHYRQLMVVLKTIPKKFISESLVYIKNIKILKVPNRILSQFKQSLNNALNNIHTKINKVVNSVKNAINPKNTNYTNNSSNDLNLIKNRELNNTDVHAVTSLLNKYNIDFKNYEIKKYIRLYRIDKSKFTQICEYCSDIDMYAPLKYFTTVFYTYKDNKPKNRFCNFPQKERSLEEWKELEKELIENYE